MARANAVPNSDSLPNDVTRPPSPPDTCTIARVSEKIPLDALRAAPSSSAFQPGRSRSTGRVEFEVRRTHFQSSFMTARCSTLGRTSWMELNRPARLTLSSVRSPGCTKMLLFETGMKLASDTRTEYRPALKPSKEKAPFSSVRARSLSLSSALSSRTAAPICGTPPASVTRPRILPESDAIEAAEETAGRERRTSAAPSQ